MNNESILCYYIKYDILLCSVDHDLDKIKDMTFYDLQFFSQPQSHIHRNLVISTSTCVELTSGLADNLLPMQT